MVLDSEETIILSKAAISDITKRQQAEAKVRQRTAQLEALRQVGLDLVTQLDTDILLRSIVARAVELMSGTSGSLGLYNPEKDVMQVIVSAGSTPMPGKPTFRRGDGLIGKVWETGQPIIVDNYRQWEGRMPAFENRPIAAIVGVPIRWGQADAAEFLGVLDVASNIPGVFSPADVELLSLFATHAAIAIRNARLFEQSHRRAEELAVLNELAQALTARLDVDNLLDEAHRGVSRLMDCTNFYIGLYNPERDVISFRYEVSESERDMSITTMPAGQGLAGYIIRNRTSVLIQDNVAERLTEMGVALVGGLALSWLGVPLMVSDRVLGVIAVQSYTTSHAYDRHDLAMLTAIASQIAVSLENAQLYEQAQREIVERKWAEEKAYSRAGHLSALNAIIAAAAATTRLSDLIEIALGHTLTALGLEMGSIWLAGQHADRGMPPEITLVGDRASELAWEDIHDAFVVEDWQQITDDNLSHFAQVMIQCGIRASITMPILVEEEYIGGLSLSSPIPHSWPIEQVALIEAVCRQLGTAAERLRLFQAEKEQRELAEALEAAAAAVNSTLDPDEVLDRILNQVARIVAGDAFHIMSVEGDQARIVRWRGYEQFGVETFISTAAFHIPDVPYLRQMLESGEPIVIPDVAVSPGWVHMPLFEWLRSYAAAPIRVREQIVGFLNVDSATPDFFTPAHARALQAFANQAAVAIENAQLYQRLRGHADELEQRVQDRTAQIQAQYARQEAILRSASDGIIVTDARGDIIQTNPIAQTWLTQTLSPEDAERLRETVRRLVEQTVAETADAETADAATVAEKQAEMILELTGLDLELKSAPISEPGIEDAAAVVAVHDVSHLKALDRIKSHFVTNISHELRTPITTIKLYAELMRKIPPEDKRWEQYLHTLSQEADRQSLLVEDILQLSRIDAGRMDLSPHPISLNKLIAGTLTKNLAMAEDRGITLEHRLAKPEPVALVDEERVVQVLNNLMENAIRYTPLGGQVLISTRLEKAKGRVWATATVSDTGMGISDEELAQIFDRFFRGTGPREMHISGTGLGLSLVKEIVELHGGWVEVESKVGIGATFTVWLPSAG